MTQFRHAGLDACKSQHESLITVLPEWKSFIRLVSVNNDVVTVVTSHVTEVWACYCCVTILRRKTSLSRRLRSGPGCFRFEAAGACCPPVRPERPALEDGPVTEAGLSQQLRAQFSVSCWPLRSRSQCHSDSGSGRYMILRLGDCTQCTVLASVTIHGPRVCSTHLSILRLTLTLRQTSFTVILIVSSSRASVRLIIEFHSGKISSSPGQILAIRGFRGPVNSELSLVSPTDHC